MDHEAQRFIAKGAAQRRTRTLLLVAALGAVATVSCIAVALQGQVYEKKSADLYHY